MPVRPDMSPVRIVTEAKPWKRAWEIARRVPNSDVLVGHGDTMRPLYVEGTVLVVQTIELSHLRPGMTVVFMNSRGDPFTMKAQVLVKQYEDGDWLVTGVKEGSPRARGQLTQSNYVGVVVAALTRATQSPREDPLEVPASSPYCTMQCHVNGEVHPQVIPSMQTPPPALPERDA